MVSNERGQMLLTTIWERYFLKEIIKIFSFFLFGFYGLYVLVDYSNHSHSFQNYHFTFIDIAIFYAYEFVTRMNVLVPFAVLIACIKTLCTLNTRNELVALMASGIRLKRILLPFVVFGFMCTAIVYFNTEVLQPQTVLYRKHFDQSRAQAKQKKHERLFVQQLALEDGSSVVFQSYDNANERFLDAYWIRSIDDIYRIHYLFPYTTVPTGQGIEHLQRNPQMELVITEFETEKSFPEMVFNKKTLLDTVTPPSGQSLSTLKEKLPLNTEQLSDKEAELLTTYYYKLALPWLCLLAVIAPAPFCVRFSRTLPVFFIYALGLFGLFAIYVIMDSAAVLAERQVIPPAIAIWGPFGVFFGIFGWRFLRL